jgi:hypothetical protein
MSTVLPFPENYRIGVTQYAVPFTADIDAWLHGILIKVLWITGTDLKTCMKVQNV